MQPINFKCEHNDDEIFEYLSDMLRQNNMSVTGTIDSAMFHNNEDTIKGSLQRVVASGMSSFVIVADTPIGKIKCDIEHRNDLLQLDVTQRPFFVSRGMILKEIKKIIPADDFFILLD